ncbi:MAG: class I SAM-dependent DNA methyltransferase [Candidatus Eisenbacteria sp.]|nr:class I SAM-dependent DNA methyltransferase [Candidatus Eisenbacteria bacterium]
MTASEFIRKWKDVTLSERSACQQHFLDLCELFEHPKPVEVDKTGESFTFEKGTEKHGGGKGWADVWKKGFFGWEYKRKHADLLKAYDQLLKYHKEALENPPLLVVCDMNIIEIHTNFTGTPSKVYRITLEELTDSDKFDVVRSVFHDPEKLKPGVTREVVTQEAAKRIGEIAQRLRKRGEDPHEVALFLDRIVFCMFAEDIDLLQSGLFTKLLGKAKDAPDRFRKMAEQLFGAMATGGDFGMDEIRHFNGYLFIDPTVLGLDNNDIHLLLDAAKLDWSAVDPSIFGTLFERGLDPDKRSQLGAHYTSREDIETLVEPVVMDHLRRKWREKQGKIQIILDKINAKKKDGSRKLTPATIKKNRQKANGLVHDYLTHLSSVKVLDPACGSGNFLYVTLQKMKDLEKEICLWAEDNGLGSFIPLVHPRQLHGIEINPYAHDLAQMTVWIGYIQWMRANGYGLPNDPVLESLHGNFQNRDAILDLTDPENPKEPGWPDVDYIIGNPPFLGRSKLRLELGDHYLDHLFVLYRGRLPESSDLCCYWYEKARAEVARVPRLRAGLLATQGIRGGANRRVLERIDEVSQIFFAESDRPWILDGANVHVSMVGFGGSGSKVAVLDSQTVSRINPNLTSCADISKARPLTENKGICTRGSQKRGAFDVTFAEAWTWLSDSPNPGGLPNSDVVVPFWNGIDLTRRTRDIWVVDFSILGT